jgi:hypothetical protein
MKIGSGTHSDPKLGRSRGGLANVDSRKERLQNVVPACFLLRKLWNRVPAHSVTDIPLHLDMPSHYNIEKITFGTPGIQGYLLCL